MPSSAKRPSDSPLIEPFDDPSPVEDIPRVRPKAEKKGKKKNNELGAEQSSKGKAPRSVKVDQYVHQARPSYPCTYSCCAVKHLRRALLFQTSRHNIPFLTRMG